MQATSSSTLKSSTSSSTLTKATTASTKRSTLSPTKSSSPGGGVGGVATTASKSKIGHIGSNASVDSKNEIQEISKKISEHADAMYRTWKSRGLGPTELLELYTNVTVGPDATEDGDFFATKVIGSDVDDKATTEGLQKLVSSFVLKDKEQRGVKGGASITGVSGGSSNVKPKKSNTTTANTETNSLTAVDNATNKTGQKHVQVLKQTTNTITKTPVETTTKKTLTAQKTSISRRSGDLSDVSVADISMAAVDVVDALTNAAKKVVKQSPVTSTNTSTHTHAKTLEKTKEPAVHNGNKNTTTVTKTKSPVAVTSATKQAKSTVDINLNFDLDMNLNLDVNNLSKMQTKNLLKIKELLQQENVVGNTVDTESVKLRKTTTATATTTPATTARTNDVTGKSKTTITTTAIVNSKSHDNQSNNNNSSASTKRIANNNIKNNNKNNHSHSGSGSSSGSGSGSSSINSLSNSSSSSIVGGTNTSTSVSISAVAISADKNSSVAAIDEQQQINTNNNINDNEQNISDGISLGKTPTIKEHDKAPKVSHRNVKNANSTKENNSHGSGGGSSSSSGSNKNGSTRVTLKDKTALERKDVKSADKENHATNNNNQNIMEVARSSMPTPTKTKTGRAALLANGQDFKNLARPILTRGSVAERVLMFEKCPDVRNSFLNIKRPDPADAPPKSLLKVKLHATPPVPSEQHSLQKEIRSTKSVYIPRFYFPHGKPQPQIALERTLRGILSAFDSFPNNQVTKDELPRILKLCGLPFYWRMPVMVFCQQSNSGLVERQRFVEFWKQMNVYCHDAASRFVYILSRGQRYRPYIMPEDLVPLVQDVVDTHPGLAFLKEATEFHSRYVHTVVARIFYSVNRCWSGKISISELKKSDLLEIISLLEEEDDINQIMAFFSYEHFYVIYCKFWELDKDHDLLINQDDLARHSDHALSTRIVERIFSGCVTRSDNRKNPDDEAKMSYTDFVWFLLSEEDKRTPTAIEYWFRCMDIDGDGALSMYELEYFYEEQQQRMDSIGIETLPFEDCLCQMLDMIKPQRRDCITLSDLKRCKMTHVFFDTFFNLEKYLDHEQRDPFASQRDEYTSDWDRFAAQEYELLITEENE